MKRYLLIVLAGLLAFHAGSGFADEAGAEEVMKTVVYPLVFGASGPLSRERQPAPRAEGRRADAPPAACRRLRRAH